MLKPLSYFYYNDKEVLKIVDIKTSVKGSICLLLGWGSSTAIHECAHITAAHACGFDATISDLSLCTGSVIVSGTLLPLQTTVIAVAGSVALILLGLIMVKSGNTWLKLMGIIFLTRAWIDVLPLAGFDGGAICGSVGYTVAVIILITEIIVCGGALAKATE